jgi:hypothetical protein
MSYALRAQSCQAVRVPTADSWQLSPGRAILFVLEEIALDLNAASR